MMKQATRRPSRFRLPDRSDVARLRRAASVTSSLFVLACAALLSCSGAGDQNREPAATGERATGDWLVFADTAEPTTLNCLRATERPARQVCRLVADTLIDFDRDAKFIPRLAGSFDLSTDDTEITFHLRKGVRWHDGDAFDAQDVIYTVEQVKRLDADQERFQALFGPLAEVTAPDSSTIRAKYSEPYADALNGWREAFIMPSHLPFAPAEPSPLDRSPVGTGPFRFLRWDAQDRIILEANKDYFAGRPLLDRFVYRIVPNLDAVRAALQVQEVDVAGLTPDWVAEHPSDDPNLPFRVEVFPAGMVEMIYWNLDEPRGLFKDPRVRRALAMLLDRQGYVQSVHHGLYGVATTLIDPEIWGGDPSLRPLPYDPAGAERLLDEAGIVDKDGDGIRDAKDGPMSFTLLYTSTAPYQKDVAALLERAAAGAGVQVRLQGLEWAAMRPRIYGHDFEAAVHRWRLDLRPDPYAFFHSSQIGAGQNLSGYRSDAFDRLAETMRRTADPAQRTSLLAAMQKRLHEDQPALFVSIPRSVIAINRRFRTPPLTSAGWWNWYPSVAEWWVAAGDRRYH